MDIKRERPKRRLRYAVLGGAALAIVVIGILLIQRLGPRHEALRRSGIWTGHVKRGPLLIRVKGAGTLVPEAVRWLTAETSGRVEEVLLTPGSEVAAETPIVRLENLDIRVLAVQSDREVANARAEIMALERALGEDEISRESDVAQLRTTMSDAQRVAEAYSKEPGTIVSVLDMRRADAQASDLKVRTALAEKRLALLRRAGPAQLATLRTQLQAQLEMTRVRQTIVDHLTVRAGAKGTLEDVLVELGQWVVPGTNVARVIISDRLKAELKVPEEQAGGIVVGHAATIDTRSGTAKGQVRRVASAASQGTVLVEIALAGEMPKGARPDQSVDGFIEIDRVDNTLYVPRPMYVEPNATTSLFRIDAKTGVSSRVSIRTGRASVDTIEILSGLAEGDEVILSDTSRYANVDSLVLE
ncbi:MAG TPA: HlyD family efflux transporter periplasmic adaptor subunit [Kofleriaceae bacterium]|nr:HlyD family efflux transporter periplasmic adaptor subunit [Kofleriaceae bacterium]